MSGILSIGSKSSHGGVIITGDPTMLVCGMPVARIGDLHACPQFYPGPVPHGVTPIIKGACGGERGKTNGVEIAVAGDRTPCGAVMLEPPLCTDADNAC